MSKLLDLIEQSYFQNNRLENAIQLSIGRLTKVERGEVLEWIVKRKQN